MKSAVETVNPTRVRLSVEVPFDELEPSVAVAYRKIAGQVQIPGFRRGKVPPRIIDQRVGRPAVLEEAVSEALPRFYGRAVAEHEVKVLGTPEVDVTEFADGAALKFTAEVDVRPEVELPDYHGLEVRVEDADVTEDELDEQLGGLRARFAVLTGVERPAGTGDFVSVDLDAVVGGGPLEDTSMRGVSYEVGSNGLLAGLDDAVVGLAAGESREFSTTLIGGDHAGADAVATVTVNSVKERELPDLDDDFAQTASEFDTMAELRADVRSRLARVKRLQQGSEAREAALEALLSGVELPLPDGVVAAEAQARTHQLDHQLESVGMTREDYLATQGQSEEEFDAEIEEGARRSVKAQFVLDAVASKESMTANEEELTEHIVRRAVQAGVSPDQFIQQVIAAGTVDLLMAEVVRGKALAFVLQRATAVDASGRPVDLKGLAADLDQLTQGSDARPDDGADLEPAAEQG